MSKQTNRFEKRKFPFIKEVYFLITLLILMSAPAAVYAQPTSVGWTGPSATSNPAPGTCGNWSATWCAGSGTYTTIALTQGINYTVENTAAATCGTALPTAYLQAWFSGGTTACSWGSIGTPGTNTISFDASLTGDHRINVTSNTGTANTCGGGTGHDFTGRSAVLRYRQNTTITNTTSTTAICMGSTKTLSFTLGGAHNNPVPVWTVVSGGGTISGTTYTPAAVGSVTIRATVGQCSSDVTFNVSPPETITMTQTNVLCNGGSTGTATATPANPGTYTYAWSPSGGTAATASNLPAGAYTVSVTNSSGCVSTGSVTITEPTAIALTTSSTITSCTANTGTATVTATGGTGAYTYAWTPSGGTAATASNLGVGTYSVTVTDANGCTANATANVQQPPPIVLTTSSTETSCVANTGTATVSATGGNGAYTYAWTPTGGNGATASSLGEGVYNITVTDASGCTQSANVSVLKMSGATLTVTSSQNVSCFGLSDGAATVTASGGTPAYTYSWSPATGSNSGTITGMSGGTYTLTVTDNAGCSSVQPVTIGVPPQISLSVNGTSTNCGNSDGTATAIGSGGTGTLSYTWMPGNLSGASISNLIAGNYTVTVTDATGCTQSLTYKVNVNGSMNISVSPSDTLIESGETVDLEAAVNPAIPGVTYSWSPAAGLSCTTCINPSATSTENTVYTVTATAPDGCVGTATAQIKIIVHCAHFIPTIFSPNGDGKNDEFCVLGNCITSMTLNVYDRWGELVFQGTNQSSCWDGTYNGSPMNPGTFLWTASMIMTDGTTVVEKGNLTLMR